MDTTPNRTDKNYQQREDRISQTVDNYSTQISPTPFLGMAVGSMALSAALAVFSNRKGLANFVGLWTPTLLLIAIYNKVSRLEQNEQHNQSLH
jgi:hypothetical protein